MPAPDQTGAIPSAAGRPPRKVKQIALAFVIVYPLVLVLNGLVAPMIDFIPQSIRGALIVLCMATVLTYVLPVANRRFAGWLAR